MNEKEINQFFQELTFSSKIEFIEESEVNEELKNILKKREIVYPSKDLSVFSCVYAFTDEANANKCILPKEEVVKSLPTLVGKSIDMDHLRKNVIGHWIDAKLEENKIIAYGVFYKGSFREEYEDFKKMLEKSLAKVSFEAWGERVYNQDGTYNLNGIEWAGGALLFNETPAFKNAGVIEIAINQKTLEFAKQMQAPEKYFDWKKDNNSNSQVNDIEKTKNGGIKEINMKEEVLDKSTEHTHEQMLSIMQEMERKIADLHVQMNEKIEALKKVEESNTEYSKVIEELKKESEEAKVKIEKIEKSKQEEVKKAREEATKIAERRNILGETELKDEEILDDIKYENAKLKKEIQEKNEQIENLKKGKIDVDLDKGQKNKDIEDETSKMRKRIDKLAWR